MALALAYYGLESLPPQVHDVPVETVGNAIGWLGRHPLVDNKRIGVYGVSKGGELALLAASVYPQLRLVLAVVPSAFVFQGMGKPPRRPPNRSSWTIGGEEVPFVPYKYSRGFVPTLLWRILTRQSVRFDEMHRDSLADKERAAKAAIAVERINGPVLLVSADDDAMWPSSRFTQTVADRLRSHDFPREVVRLDYPEAGHQVLPPYSPTTAWLRWNGGTPQRNAAAAEDSWRRMIAFLHRHFSGQTRRTDRR